MKIQLSESAYNDLSDGYTFYELQKQGLGAYFQDSLFSDIDSLSLYAGIHPAFLGKYRMLSNRFPYAIYYTINDDVVIVSAVLDCRRNPDWTQKKIDE